MIRLGAGLLPCSKKRANPLCLKLKTIADYTPASATLGDVFKSNESRWVTSFRNPMHCVVNVGLKKHQPNLRSYMLSIARGVTGCNTSLCACKRVLISHHFCSLLAGGYC